jgi:DNA-binding transcriptional ArsR family regulator
MSTYARLLLVTGKENLAFDALSDRVRRQILLVLGENGELTVTDITERVGMVGRTTVSSHLRILRTSGVVNERREGRRRLYSLDTEGSVRDALLFLQGILRAGLDLDSTSMAEADSSERSERNAG